MLPEVRVTHLHVFFVRKKAVKDTGLLSGAVCLQCIQRDCGRVQSGQAVCTVYASVQHIGKHGQRIDPDGTPSGGEGELKAEIGFRKFKLCRGKQLCMDALALPEQKLPVNVFRMGAYPERNVTGLPDTDSADNKVLACVQKEI